MGITRYALDRAALDERARRASEPATDFTVSYDDFLEWADEDTLAEWVDGKAVVTSPASLRHQQIAVFLTNVLSLYVAMRDLGTVLNAPFQMKLSRSGREPDLLFVSRAHQRRLRASRIEGAADLVVEIVSPESARRDSVDKLGEYEQGGVREYWLIDPMARTATFYQLDAQSQYATVAPDEAGRYRSVALPGFWLDVAWLWRDPLPDVVGVLSAIAGGEFARYVARQTPP